MTTEQQVVALTARLDAVEATMAEKDAVAAEMAAVKRQLELHEIQIRGAASSAEQLARATETMAQMITQVKSEQKRDTAKELKGFDYRTMVKPEPFGGKLEEFEGWHELFVTMLVAMDKKWEEILKSIRAYRKEPITDDVADDIIQNLMMEQEQLPNIKRMLYVLMLQYTKGDVHGKVISNGIEGAMETYRYIHDKGKNDTTTNILRVKMRVMHPDNAAKIEDVETKLNKWKEDIRYLRETGHKDMEDVQMRTILISMLPEDVADPLIKKFEELDNYDKLEKELLTMLRNNEMKSGKRKTANINKIGEQEDENDKPQPAMYYWDDEKEAFIGMTAPGNKRPRTEDHENHEEHGGGKGDPKGTGKGKGPKSGCFTCGGDHYQSKCPHKGKGKGDKGKGKGKESNYFNTRTWNG